MVDTASGLRTMWNTHVRADAGFGCDAMTMLAPPAPSSSLILPQLVQQAEPHVQARFLEFFAATIRNANTRRAYARRCADFLAWCAVRQVTALSGI